MKLLLVTDAVGGVWVYSLELARALRPLGVETILAVTGPSPDAKRREDANGFELIDTGLPLDWFETSPGELRRAGERIAAIADREQADVVQTCSAALLADAHFTQPSIAVQHSCVATWWAAVRRTPLPADFEWRRELVERGIDRASVVIAPTRAFAVETMRAYDLQTPVLAVHNGRRPIAAGVVPQADFVFTASRLWDEGKNVTTLDAAAAQVGAPFEAAGAVDGPNGAHIDLHHLRLLGEISASHMAGLLAARPVFASAALYEPFGLSVLEAAHAGCALVLADIATHRELWRDCAVFVPPRDPGAFARAITRLLNDRDRRNALGRAGHARALLYSPERMAERMAGIYERVAKPALAPMPIELAGAA